MTTESQTWVSGSCTLPATHQQVRLAEFDSLIRAGVRGQERLTPTVLRWLLDPAVESSARALTSLESECCAFFSFHFTRHDDDLLLDVEVTANHSGALDELQERADNVLTT